MECNPTVVPLLLTQSLTGSAPVEETEYVQEQVDHIHVNNDCGQNIVLGTDCEPSSADYELGIDHQKEAEEDSPEGRVDQIDHVVAASDARDEAKEDENPEHNERELMTNREVYFGLKGEGRQRKENGQRYSHGIYDYLRLEGRDDVTQHHRHEQREDRQTYEVLGKRSSNSFTTRDGDTHD